MQETQELQVQSLGQEVPLDEEMAKFIFHIPCLALESAISPMSPSETKIWVLIAQTCSLCF